MFNDFITTPFPLRGARLRQVDGDVGDIREGCFHGIHSI